MSETSTAPETAPIDPAVEAALVASREARIESLLEFARIPSVSALHEHAGDMVATAEWIAGRLRGLGATEVEVIATDLHPIVYGRIHEAPGAPTVIVYCHYDVQPVDPLDLWEHPPFEPFVRDGRFIGRGVSDDKGQLVMHLSALEALRAAGRTPAVNLTFVFEGEEEYGSASLEAWIPEHRDRLEADVVVISDTGFFEGNLPAITVGLARASCTRRSTSSCSPVDLHSGMYGGTVHNPANALATIVAALKGPDGRVRIPGFYDDVVRADRRRARGVRRPAVRRRGVPRRDPRPGARGRGRLDDARAAGARPSLDVNGMWSGFQGEGAKTIIPAHAHAKISARLVAAQDPTRSSRRCATMWRRVAPAGVTVTTVYHHGGLPSLTPSDHPATMAAARALHAEYGVDPSSSARAARSRSPRCSSTTSACRSSCSGSRSRPATRTRPTSGSWSRTSSAARGSSCACGTSSQRRPESAPPPDGRARHPVPSAHPRASGRVAARQKPGARMQLTAIAGGTQARDDGDGEARRPRGASKVRTGAWRPARRSMCSSTSTRR